MRGEHTIVAAPEKVLGCFPFAQQGPPLVIDSLYKYICDSERSKKKTKRDPILLLLMGREWAINIPSVAEIIDEVRFKGLWKRGLGLQKTKRPPGISVFILGMQRLTTA